MDRRSFREKDVKELFTEGSAATDAKKKRRHMPVRKKKGLMEWETHYRY